MSDDRKENLRKLLISSGIDEEFADEVARTSRPLTEEERKYAGRRLEEGMVTRFSGPVDLPKQRSGSLIELADKVGIGVVDTAIRIHDSGERVRDKITNLSSVARDLVNTIKEELGFSKGSNRGYKS